MREREIIPTSPIDPLRRLSRDTSSKFANTSGGNFLQLLRLDEKFPTDYIWSYENNS